MSFIPPFPSIQLKLLNIFLIQGSQQILIKWRDVQPNGERGLSLYSRISFLQIVQSAKIIFLHSISEIIMAPTVYFSLLLPVTFPCHLIALSRSIGLLALRGDTKSFQLLFAIQFQNKKFDNYLCRSWKSNKLITIESAIEKRSHNQMYQTDTKNGAK